MATKRQIAANRRNAQKSTGPRSTAGKKRASRSSYRHGLRARTVPGSERAKRIERLAQKMAGRGAGAVVLEGARAAAEAEFDMAQIRQVRVAVIEPEQTAAASDAPSNSPMARQTCASATTATGVTTEQACLAEAVRRVLPELLKLDRYERRAAGRRDRAMQVILDTKR
jgi:imidazole glycerol phosphate synthase subunit HisF